MNGVCVVWKGAIDLRRLDGTGRLEYDEDRAQVSTGTHLYRTRQIIIIVFVPGEFHRLRVEIICPPLFTMKRCSVLETTSHLKAFERPATS